LNLSASLVFLSCQNNWKILNYNNFGAWNLLQDKVRYIGYRLWTQVVLAEK